MKLTKDRLDFLEKSYTWRRLFEDEYAQLCRYARKYQFMYSVPELIVLSRARAVVDQVTERIK